MTGAGHAGETVPVLVTTTNDVPGYRIHTVIGPVLGVAARTTSGYAEGFNSTLDGHSVGLRERVDILARFRMDAVDHLIEQASAVGANAVVTMRFDHRMVTDSWCEICAYGTAVWVVPLLAPEIPVQAPPVPPQARRETEDPTLRTSAR